MLTHFLPSMNAELGSLTIAIIVTLFIFSAVPVSILISKSMGAQGVGKMLGKFCKKQDFGDLDKKQESILQELVSGCFVMGGAGLAKVSVIKGFVKTSGNAELYLSVIKREFQVDAENLGAPEFLNYLSFFGKLTYSLPDALIINKKEQPIETSFLGNKLEITNSVDEFSTVFEVRSPDIRLEKVNIPDEIQKTLLRYSQNYPLVFIGSDEVSCVFINKKGVSIIVPLTQKESDFMSLFELGAELTETIKSMGNPELEGN